MRERPKTREEAEAVLKEIVRDHGEGFGIEDLVAEFRANTGPARYFIIRLQGDDPTGFEIEAVRTAADQMAEEIEEFVNAAERWEVWEEAVEIIGNRLEARNIAYGIEQQEKRKPARAGT